MKKMKTFAKAASILLGVGMFLVYTPLKESVQPVLPVQEVVSAHAMSPYPIRLRKFPYPYQAMLAIASDADHETLRKFNLVHQFLNTKEMTPMGQGVGLDVADSFFLYNGSDLPVPVDAGGVPLSREFTYFRGISGQRYGADIIDSYIHDGWIDSLHTYGDFSMANPQKTRFSRKLAEQALRALEKANDRISVWIDHGNQSNVDNFGSYGTRSFYNYQQGALPASPYYHTDLLIPYGIQFVWADRNSSIFGHDSMIYPLSLPDGRKVWGFWRYTNDRNARGAIRWLWSVDSLAEQLSGSHLQSLVRNHQYAILAQHLCADNTPLPLPQNAISSLRYLAQEQQEGRILVARTSRLLRYNVTEQYLRYHVTMQGQRAVIHLDAIADPVFGTHLPTLEELRGITFYTENPQQTELAIGNKLIDRDLLQENPSDGTAPSIGIRWYEPDTQNHARTDPRVS